jgi:hypothetical protein
VKELFTKWNKNAVGCSDKSPKEKNGNQYSKLRPFGLLVHARVVLLMPQNNYIYQSIKTFCSQIQMNRT